MPAEPSCKDCSFQRHQRLISQADFSRVFENKRRSSDSLFTVCGKTNDFGHPRLGMAVSIKSTGNAVRRNRVKRAIRESFRLAASSLGPIDFVVTSRQGVADAEQSTLRQSLDRHWQKVVEKCAA